VDRANDGLVLVCDDDPDTLEVLRLVVEGLAGVRVAVATSGGDALALASKVRPDLVLMDIRMPGTGGLEATRRLKADPTTRAIPVIAVTALPNAREAAVEAGCTDCIEKPFDVDVVVRVVRKHIAGSASSGLTLP
jgi:CheY-like chemotaxis protein